MFLISVKTGDNGRLFNGRGDGPDQKGYVLLSLNFACLMMSFIALESCINEINS